MFVFGVAQAPLLSLDLGFPWIHKLPFPVKSCMKHCRKEANPDFHFRDKEIKFIQILYSRSRLIGIPRE